MQSIFFFFFFFWRGRENLLFSELAGSRRESAGAWVTVCAIFARLGGCTGRAHARHVERKVVAPSAVKWVTAVSNQRAWWGWGCGGVPTGSIMALDGL